jgi:LCP family protein required for cell wall assembly
VRRVLLALVLVWVLFLVVVPIWAWSQIEKVDASPDGARPGDQDGTTFLVVGSDSRDGLTEQEREDLSTGNAGGQRTDTIMLLHSGDGPTTLISVPRDSPVEIPGHGTTKVNAAFAFGGPELLVETIEQNTGIRVDGYVEIGLGGFVNIVDALGGVEICPQEAIDDPKAGLDLEAGCQEADGPTALGYARSRATFDISDLQRVQNQREVVSAIADDTASPWTVLNPWRYFTLASAGSDSLRIGDDVGPIDLARFAWAMGEVSGGGKTCTVPLADPSGTWDADRSEQMFRLVIEDRTDELDGGLCPRSGLQTS